MRKIKDRIRTLFYVTKYQHILRKATFGANIKIRCKLKITGPGKVTIGGNCELARDPWNDDYVTIYTHRPGARIEIGNNVILRATRFGSHLSIKIGDNTILENASIYDSDFHNIDATKRDEGFNKNDRPVVIGEGCYVGCECLCSKGTILSPHVTMLPGSVVGTKTIPANSLVFGNPGKILKKDHAGMEF